jgi:hypothetical protein
MLNDLVPFVRFGQFVGLFPYSIESNLLNDKPQWFRFSIRHPVTFYFVLVLIFQIAPLFVSSRVYGNLTNDLKSSRVSLVFTIPLFVSLAVHYVTIAVSRRVTLRYHQLALAINFLNNEAIRDLERLRATNGCTNTLKKRAFIGIFFILTTVKLSQSFIENVINLFGPVF